jgi:hypothetical protein
MQTEITLIMSFKDEDENKINLSVDNPKGDITEDEIKECMQLIVDKNIFYANGLDLVSFENAKVVQTTTTNYDFL